MRASARAGLVTQRFTAAFPYPFRRSTPLPPMENDAGEAENTSVRGGREYAKENNALYSFSAFLPVDE